MRQPATAATMPMPPTLHAHGTRVHCRRPTWSRLLLCGAAALALRFASPALATAACDTDALRGHSQQALADYTITDVNADDGVVTVVINSTEHGTYALAMRTAGTAFFTSVTGANFDPTERARLSAVVASWYERHDIQQLLAACCERTELSASAAQDRVRSAASLALGSLRGGSTSEALISLTALLASLVLVCWPGRSAATSNAKRLLPSRLDIVLLLTIAVTALAIAGSVAWQLAPEADEVATLGARHEALTAVLAWNVRAEPFSPPGVPLLFALWLRVVGGFFAARLLSLALIPLTAVAAYWSGRCLSDRVTGLCFAALLLLAPSYLRLAAIARGYACITLVLCLLLAAVARTFHVDSRGRGVGAVGLLALWTSYLLWPLAFAAPCVARLERRDCLRLTAALTLTALGLLPQVLNGFGAALAKPDSFELAGFADTLAAALTSVGQLPPSDYAHSPPAAWLAGGLGITLVLATFLRRDNGVTSCLHLAWAALVAVALPVLALLAGGHGIRERHVIALQVGLTLLAALGLGGLLTNPRRALRTLGIVLAATLLFASFRGSQALIQQTGGWIPELRRLCAGADLLVLVPRQAQGALLAMLTGDAPNATPMIAWPPVCATDNETWCQRIDDLSIIAVDVADDAVAQSAARFEHSLWIFEARPAGDTGLVPDVMRNCTTLLADTHWSAFECTAAELRR